MSTFYATTPIYYINDVPHLGTAYTTIAVDVLTRYHRVRGDDTRFLTGTDEHGLKIERVAQERGITNAAFADSAAQPFKDAWPMLSCAFDDFIRTTEPRHQKHVQELWRKVRDAGDLYLGAYEGWYCVGCEAYYTEKELEQPDNVCPVHKKPVERVKEPSYFFRLNKYQERLLKFYEEHPSFVAPPSRLNEVMSFVRSGLDDISVSRTTFQWGIPVPDDPQHVMWVWFDALPNYWSAIQEPPELRKYWPPNIHFVGKDILRFHAIYWPAFLMAAGFSDDQLPKQVFAHGFLTFNGQKMSKSLRNTVKPVALADAFGIDSVRYYLMRAIAFGQDGDFSLSDLVQRYNSELGNALGNLLNRVLPQCRKLPEYKLPARGELTELETNLLAEARTQSAAASVAFDAVAPQRALDAIFALLGTANQYIDRAAPWTAAKQGDLARLGTILAVALEVMESVSILIWPVMPGIADQIREQLGLGPVVPVIGKDLWPTEAATGNAGRALGDAKPLFPRIDKEREAQLVASLGIGDGAAPPAPPAQAKEAAPTAQDATGATTQITYDDFAKLDLRLGVVIAAEKVKGKDKLLSLKVDLGEPEPRGLVAGIALTYTPEEMIGKRIMVVSNLAPRKFGKGLVSNGMLLCAKDGDKLTLMTSLVELPPGSKIS
ncbi:MAG: methionine--tRNA ligase [Deltaproteobacteria bacterium]|nr:methionine--tRNA ligase [Deltaproteobacteria bacterium]